MFPAIVNASSIQRYLINDEKRYWIVLNDLASFEVARLKAPYLSAQLSRHESDLRRSLGSEWWRFPNVRNLSFFSQRKPKLLTARTASTNSFAIDTAGYVFKGTNAYISIAPPYSHHYLAAVMNSTLLDRYYGQFGKAYHGKFRKYEPGKINHLPIYRITFTANVEKRLQWLHEMTDLYTDFKYGGLIAQVEEHSHTGTTDVIHDLLAFLAEEMTTLWSELQRETSSFLEWLGDRLRIIPTEEQAGLDVLAGKSIISGYAGTSGEHVQPWPEIEYYLYRNRNKYQVGWAAVKGEVQAEYEKSLETLRPIKQRLAETDALIDKIVYRLYGLTEEEVRLIEQPAYEQALTAARAQVAADKKLQRDPDAAVDAVAEKVLPAAQRLLQRVAHAAERAALDAALPGWELYPDPVPTFLLTGEYSIQQLPDHLDFAASVVSYAKAVETMLFHRLFLPFRDEAGKLPGSPTPAEASNKFLRQFLGGERDKLTLGSMQIILASSKEAALRAFAASRFYDAPTRLFGPDGVAALLNDDTAVALRNAAAHDQLMTRADAQSARTWAVGILEKL